MFGFFKSNVPEISAQEVKQLLDKGETITLLDVRTPQEFSKNRIKGAINIPVENVSTKIVQQIPDKTKKIVVYCLSASRSTYVVPILQKLGYINVFNMTSGLLAWRANQYPLEMNS